MQQLRAVLREFYPAALVAFGTDLTDRDGDRDALAVLERAPSPNAARSLSRSSIAAILRRAGRRRNVDARAAEIQGAFRSEQLEPPDILAGAYAELVRSAVAVIAEMDRQLAALETELADHFEKHPDAEIIRSIPGLGVIVGARVLGEFGDDPNRYANAKARRNYAGTSPITIASGKLKVVRARYIGNRFVADACYWWAFCSLSQSASARAYYDHLKARGVDHDAALRALANRLVGILDGCLRHRALYDETTAWGTAKPPEPRSTPRLLSKATPPASLSCPRLATSWNHGQRRPRIAVPRTRAAPLRRGSKPSNKISKTTP